MKGSDNMKYILKAGKELTIGFLEGFIGVLLGLFALAHIYSAFANNKKD